MKAKIYLTKKEDLVEAFLEAHKLANTEIQPTKTEEKLNRKEASKFLDVA